MKKKLVSMILVGVMLFTAACGVKQEDYDKVVEELAQIKEKYEQSSEEQSSKLDDYAIKTELTLNFNFGERTGIYTGDFKNGLPNGYGAFESIALDGNSWIYYGQWIDGHFSGKGISTWSNGNTTMSTFKNDEKDGHSLFFNSTTGQTSCEVYADGEFLYYLGEPESVEDSIDSSDYKKLISQYNKDIIELSTILSSMGIYEHNYWKALISVNGTLDHKKTVENAYEWIEKEKELDQEKIETAYKKIEKQYVEISTIDTSSAEEEELKTRAAELYDAFSSLYGMVNSPPSSIDDFAKLYDQYIADIKTSNNLLSALVGDE